MLSNYSAWVTRFMESWKALDGVKTTELLSKNVQYFETPDGEPCASWEEVLALWKVVSTNQRDITYSFEILAANEKTCIVNWKMRRTFLNASESVKQKIDGIFQISLDREGLCIYFKQWRYTAIERT